MVFLDQGSASSIQQHAQEVTKSLGQCLFLLATLKPTEKPSLDHECAEATEALLRSQGQVTASENGRSASHFAVGNYELQADLNDRSGRPTFAMYDLETGEKVMSARRSSKGDYELHAVNQPLSVEQQQAFLSQLHQTLQGEPVVGLTGLERLQAMTQAMDDQAPRGCKAMLVASALLGDQREASDQQYTYTRREDGSLSITDTKAQALVAVLSATGKLDQALSQRDQAYFKQAYDRLQLKSRQTQAVKASDLTLEVDGREERSLLAAQAAVVHLRERGTQATQVAVVAPLEVVDGEFVEPPGLHRVQSRVAAMGLESAGGDLALTVGAQLVAQQSGSEYHGERYHVTTYDHGAMTIHATGNPVPLVYANSAGEVTSQLTPEQTTQFRQMYQSLSQSQMATSALAATRSTPRLNPARSFDLGGL